MLNLVDMDVSSCTGENRERPKRLHLKRLGENSFLCGFLAFGIAKDETINNEKKYYFFMFCVVP